MRALANDDLQWGVYVDRGRGTIRWQLGQPPPPGGLLMFRAEPAFVIPGATPSGRDNSHILPRVLQLRRIPGEGTVEDVWDRVRKAIAAKAA